MLSDDEINEEIKKSIERYAMKKVNKRRATAFYILGLLSGTAITLVTILIRQ